MINKDSLEVVGAHVAAIAVTYTDVEHCLKITSLLVAIGYALYKWYIDYKRNKK